MWSDEFIDFTLMQSIWIFYVWTIHRHIIGTVQKIPQFSTREVSKIIFDLVANFEEGEFENYRYFLK